MTILLIVILALILIVGLYIYSTQRGLVDLDEKANNAISQIAVQLNSRWDAVTALVKLTEQYAKHEHDTMLETIAQRRMHSITTADDINNQQTVIGQLMGRLMAVSEAYPQLQAAGVYKEAMASLRGYEENVRLSRMVYNDSVTKMNRMVRQWPSSFVASMLHFGKREYLQADESKKDFPPVGGNGPASAQGSGGVNADSKPRNPIGFKTGGEPESQN
ncbi:MAG: LemA family protein [Bacteroidales bacterium]|nr:LemA family protein [Bacteroidales bacterium]MBQ4196423.1 LemA family protein [Bacteroidales bacterium]